MKFKLAWYSGLFLSTKFLCHKNFLVLNKRNKTYGNFKLPPLKNGKSKLRKYKPCISCCIKSLKCVLRSIKYVIHLRLIVTQQEPISYKCLRIYEESEQ